MIQIILCRTCSRRSNGGSLFPYPCSFGSRHWAPSQIPLTGQLGLLNITGSHLFLRTSVNTTFLPLLFLNILTKKMSLGNSLFLTEYCHLHKVRNVVVHNGGMVQYWDRPDVLEDAVC